MSPQAVSNIIDDLQHDDMLLAHTPSRIPHGQPPVPFSLNPDGGFAIGFYMTEHCVTSVLIDLAGQTRSVLADDVNSPTLAGTLPVAKQHVATFRESFPDKHILGIGVAVPAPLYSDISARTYTAVEAPLYSDANIAELEAETGLSVHMESDAAAAATGECLYGAAKRLNDFTYLFIGRQLRAVTFLSNQLLAGYRHDAGQIGRLVMKADGQPSHRGKHGCLGRYLSEARFLEYLAVEPSQHIESLDMRDYTPGITRFVEDSASALHYATDVLESVLDPESVVIGGTVPSVALQALIDKAFPTASSESDRIAERQARIKLGATGAKCVAAGAASTIMMTKFKPQHI